MHQPPPVCSFSLNVRHFVSCLQHRPLAQRCLLAVVGAGRSQQLWWHRCQLPVHQSWAQLKLIMDVKDAKLLNKHFVALDVLWKCLIWITMFLVFRVLMLWIKNILQIQVVSKRQTFKNTGLTCKKYSKVYDIELPPVQHRFWLKPYEKH